MLTFLTYFVLVMNGNRINRFHLFWDTLYFVAESIRTDGLNFGFAESMQISGKNIWIKVTICNRKWHLDVRRLTYRRFCFSVSIIR